LIIAIYIAISLARLISIEQIRNALEGLRFAIKILIVLALIGVLSHVGKGFDNAPNTSARQIDYSKGK
jgi:hypothetical protein